MPLSPNGKVDRNALMELRPQERVLSSDQVPSSPEEKMLAGIWGDLLKIQAIGKTDNFFELGGHSLLALQMLSRIRDSLQVELPLRHVFERPTLERLARSLADHRAGTTPAPQQIPRIQRQAMHREEIDQWEGAPVREGENPLNQAENAAKLE